MGCLACGSPFENDAHFTDCWMAYLHPGRNRHEAKQLLEQLYERAKAAEARAAQAQAERDAARQRAERLEAVLTELLAALNPSLDTWSGANWARIGRAKAAARAALDGAGA